MTNTCLQFDLFELRELPKAVLFEWEDDDVFAIREHLVYRSLSHVADRRSNEDTLADVNCWISSDEIHPFSFIVCCQALGLDYNAVRDGISNCIMQIDKRK